MKRIVSILLILALTLTLVSALAACKSRDEVLKLYMPGEYIDEELFEEFEDENEEEDFTPLSETAKDVTEAVADAADEAGKTVEEFFDDTDTAEGTSEEVDDK